MSGAGREREIDFAVARHVLGVEPCDSWSLFHHGGPSGPTYMKRDSCAHEPGRCTARQLFPGRYSETWNGAGLVIEAMRDRHRMFVKLENDATLPGDETPTTWFVAEFSNFVEGEVDCVGVATSVSAPLAVALAALRALGAAPAVAEGEPHA